MFKAFLGLTISFIFLTGCQYIENHNLTKEQKIEKPTTHTEDTTQNDQNQNVDQEIKEEEPINSNFFLEEKYFNEVKVSNGQAIIQNPDNILVLVNKEYSLPQDYVPQDLTKPNIPFSFGDLDIPKRYMREEAARAVEEMFQAAKIDGIFLYGVSAFRPYNYQLNLFNNEVNEKGEELAVQAVARPGQSEHQTGLTIDITSESVQYQITQKFGETKEGKWVEENAYKFGFIIRYPKGKEKITKYQYEPWHIRYVGKKVAKIIKEHDLTLEEYFEKVKKI